MLPKGDSVRECYVKANPAIKQQCARVRKAKVYENAIQKQSLPKGNKQCTRMLYKANAAIERQCARMLHAAAKADLL